MTGETYVTPFDLVSGTFGTPKYNVCSARKSVLGPDGARLITADWCQGVTIRDTPAFELKGFNCLPSGAGNYIVLAPNSATLSYVGWGGGVIPFDWDQSTLAFGTAIPVGGSGVVGGVAITPDGASVIASRLFDQSVRLVSTATNTAGATIAVGNNPSAIAVTQAPKCPGGVTPQLLPAEWVDASQNGGVFSQLTASVSFDATNDGQSPDWYKLVSVCFINGVPTPVSPLTAGDQPATVAAAATAPKAVKLKACSKTKPRPPCLLGKTVTDGVAQASMLLPATGGTFRVVTPAVKISRLKPESASPGSSVTILGRNMGVVTGVLIGGAEAPITARTRTKLQVTVPDAVGSGDVTVLTPSGAVAAPKPLILVP